MGINSHRGGRKESEKPRRRPRFDAETRKCIGELLGLLNRFVTAAVSGNLIVSAVEALEEYMEDRLGFIRSVMLSLRFLHPEFISGLEASGLTETEIGYCCLYCIGMNGSEISSYLGRKSFFNDICAIRKKLGLGRHDMNIDRYLREEGSRY